jgi:clan AA aspartic protease
MAIHGKVTAAREPVVVFQTLPDKRKISVIVDTGFSGELCLPPSLIRNMGFERVGREAYVLADGQIVHADIHKAEIDWLSRRRPVEIIALDNP